MSDVTHFGSIKDMTTRTQMVVKLLEINFFSRKRVFGCGLLEGGLLTQMKISKYHFYRKFLPNGYSNGSRTSLLEASKVLVEMGHCWQTDGVKAKN